MGRKERKVPPPKTDRGTIPFGGRGGAKSWNRSKGERTIRHLVSDGSRRKKIKKPKEAKVTQNVPPGGSKVGGSNLEAAISGGRKERFSGDPKATARMRDHASPGEGGKI